VIVIDGGAGYGQVVAKEAMDIGIERAKKHGVAVVGLKNSHHIGRVGHWGEQCAWAGLVSTHWVNVHGHKSLAAPFGGAEPRFTTNPYCTAVPRQGQEPIVLDFATSQVAMGKVRVANNKKVMMDEGLLIDSAGRPTTDPSVMYNAPYGAILPFGLHKGGGLAVICDLLAGALTGGRTQYMFAVPFLTTLIDRIDARNILLVGSIGSALATLAFGFFRKRLVVGHAYLGFGRRWFCRRLHARPQGSYGPFATWRCVPQRDALHIHLLGRRRAFVSSQPARGG
jgi:hypothetical protein